MLLAAGRELPADLLARLKAATKKMQELAERRNDIAHEAVILLESATGDLTGGVPKPPGKGPRQAIEAPGLHSAEEIAEYTHETMDLGIEMERIAQALDNARGNSPGAIIKY